MPVPMSASAVRAGAVLALGSFAVMAVMHAMDMRPSTALASRQGAPAAVEVMLDGEEVALSPLGLAARYVTIDISYMRWLWWPAILYLFWCMAFVCDVYFVRTIEVISERFKIPDDVAGATLMALGCNGPEMALNTINIFHPSNIGVGAVVGGEVFNVLVIIGTALLATPDMYMPLKLGKFNFFRDVIFYMVSVALLYWVLRDGLISRLNAVVLLFGAVCYTVTVVYSTRIAERLSRNKTLRMTKTLLARATMKMTAVLATLGAGADDDDDDEDEDADPATVDRWDEALDCADPAKGSVLTVRVDVRNRMMDRTHPVTTRYIWLRDDALIVSTLVDPNPEMQMLKRTNTGIVFDHNSQTHEKHWHHGGLVNEPCFLDENGQPKNVPRGEPGELSRPLLNEPSKRAGEESPSLPPPMKIPGFVDAPWEIIPLEDVLYCERLGGDGQNNFNLHVHQHDSVLGNLITIELSTQKALVMDAWVTAIRAKLLDQRRKNVDGPTHKGFSDSLMEWVEWVQFPVKWFVARSIPDMDNPKLHDYYPLAFVMSMVWLAIFAFSVVKACDGIHNDFGISDDILGFTVAAAGTSFPNVFSGMCVAKQGKTSMAVANALGANVQNVFLALAIPWTIQSFFIVGGPFPMEVDNLLPAVLECAITLAPVVIIYLLYGCSMPRWSGGMFLLVYVVYVVFALGQQVSKCPIWPLSCGGAA